MRAGFVMGGSLAATWAIDGSPTDSRMLGTVASAGPAPKRGGTLTWGMQEDPVALAPYGVSNTSGFEVNVFMYESLLGWDRSFKVIPALAESWQIPDNRTYVFKLRQGVKFHSGKELDADDVKYSLELQKSPPPPFVVNNYYPKIASVEVVDKYTARVHMVEPDATMLGYLAWGRWSWIIPKGLYDRMDVRTHADGTGPFKLVEYIPNDHTTFTRHTDYWNPQLPYLDGLTMKVMHDEQARIAAVRTGAIDGTTVSADGAKVLARDPNLLVLKGLTGAFRELEFTIHSDVKPWNNVKVRQAVNAAIDRQAIIDQVYGGQAVYTSKMAAGYGDWPIPDTTLKAMYEKCDLARAKQLMTEAGIPNGFAVTLQSIAHPEDYTQVAEVVKEQLRQININVTVQPLETGTFGLNNSTGAFAWQLTGRGMRGDPAGFLGDFDPQSPLYKAWFAGGYQNQELTNLYYQGIHETVPVKRLPLYRRMQEIVLTEWPLIPLVNPMKYQVVRKRLSDMYVSFDDTERGLIRTWVG